MRRIIFTFILIALMSGNYITASAASPNNHAETTESTSDSKASVGGGLLILLSLGIGYSFRKIHDIRQMSKGLQD